MNDTLESHQAWLLEHTAPAGDCMEWRFGVNKKGYATIRYLGEQWYAHRLSYTLFNGEIEKGLYVCHRCDNPKCINPAHLFTGTAGDNARDCAAKGRFHRQGTTECIHGHIYTDADWTLCKGVRVRKCKRCRAAYVSRLYYSKKAQHDG